MSDKKKKEEKQEPQTKQETVEEVKVVPAITKREVSRSYPTTLGFDVEFVLRNGKFLVPANDYISDPKKNKAVGLDGVTDLVEMRGGIATNPSQIVESIHHNLRNNMPPMARMCKIFAGAYPSGNPIGCHMHYGNAPGLQNSKVRNSVACSVNLLCALIEPKPDGFLRFSNSKLSGNPYGNLDFFAVKDYGIENKSPFSFIHDPAITEAIFTLGALAVMFVLPPSSGGLGMSGGFSASNAQTMFDERQYEKLRTYFLTNMIPALENETGIRTAIKEKHNLDFHFTEQEMASIALIKKIVEEGWEYNSETDLRKSWSFKHEPIQYIYPNTVNLDRQYPFLNIESTPSLRPIYVRASRGNDVSVMLSGFSDEELKVVEPSLASQGYSYKVLRHLKDAYRDCPTINININIVQEAAEKQILYSVKKALEAK